MSDVLAGLTGTRNTRFLQRRVLVVDDDPTFVLLATETLQQAGFMLMSAATVQEALAAFASFAPDLVLLDVGLPGGSGYDVCRSIREAASNSDIPVVLVTGHNDTASIEASFEAGATDFMPKPVLWPTLPHRVDFMLRSLDARRGFSRSEKRIRTLLQALPDASIIVDRRGCIIEHLIGSGRAALTGDATGLRQAAHGLKSSSQNIGAMGLAKLCQEVELAAGDHRLEVAEELVERLIREHEKVLQSLNEKVAAAPAAATPAVSRR